MSISPRRLRIGVGLGVLVAISAATLSACPRSDYAHRFANQFPARAKARSLAQVASVTAYDQRFMAPPPARLDNDQGDLAWQTSYRMTSLNEMYRLTGNAKYLRRNLEWAARVMEARDDVLGHRRWTGESGPVWSSKAFGTRGRAAHSVHTAMITYPILDLLTLSGASSSQNQKLLQETLRSLHAHDHQWRDGPGKGEGHYVYAREQEPEREGEPLPINRNNAMAKSLWLAWKLTGRAEYRDRTLALGRFFKNRLQTTQAGAYTWPYEVPLAPEAEPRASEDSSHGALTASLAPLLAADGQVFTESDLERFANTVVNGVAVSGSGVISGDVEGSEKADPAWVDLPARWLEFAPYNPDIYPRIAEYYQRYDSDNSPNTGSLAMALLLRYQPHPQSAERLRRRDIRARIRASAPAPAHGSVQGGR